MAIQERVLFPALENGTLFCLQHFHLMAQFGCIPLCPLKITYFEKFIHCRNFFIGGAANAFMFRD